MSRVIELVWFHVKDGYEAKIPGIVQGISNELASTPGLEALYYGVGTTIPQGFKGLNVIKIWSSADAQGAHLKSPAGHEYKIAREVIDDTDPVRPPNSVSFTPAPSTRLFDVFTAHTVLLSCIWLPSPGEGGSQRAAFEARRAEVGREFRLGLRGNRPMVVDACSVPGSLHPVVGGTEGFLSLFACADLDEARSVASRNDEVLSRLGEFSETYDQQYAHFDRVK